MASLISCLYFGLNPIYAQRHEIFSPHIASLQVVAGDNWQAMPIIELNGSDCINISFDELSHTYHRFAYQIEHCDADWKTSENLFESDFVDGFAEGNMIEYNAQSINTNQIYTHYSLSIPNDKCKLKISGNYKVTIVDENDNSSPIVKAYFMVTENVVSPSFSITTNTDIDINQSHQQIGMKMSYGNLRVTNPNTQIKTVLLQNRRWDNAVYNAKPQYIQVDGLMWEHCRSFIFDAGNEYRKFEILDPTHTTMGLERVGWDGKQYHAWIWPDEPRTNYIYDEDANGSYFIRNSNNIGNDTESDYVITHFRLASPRLPYDVYINGDWTHGQFSDRYNMEWNGTDNIYELSIPLKLGYYNYQYLFIDNEGLTHIVPSEGNFYQTENSYQALIYYRGLGERTDRLVGFGEASTK